MSLIVLVFAACFWAYNKDNYYLSFKWDLFWWGFGGSVTNILGMVSLQISLSQGPAGPIAAFVSISNVFLTLLECAYYTKMLRSMEIVGLVIGFLGSLFLVIPEAFSRIVRFLRICK